MPIPQVFFTTKTAQGIAFCNRDKERALLKKNIEKGQHTVVVAPRRYGKTSLVHKVLEDMGIEYAEIDLFCVVYTQGVCEKIAYAVSQVIRRMVPFTQKMLQFIGSCFKHTNVVVKAGGFELKLELTKPTFDPAAEVTDILLGLEKLAAKQNKRVVVFLDEFQDLLRVDETNAIQAAIRAVAQNTQHLCFVFSGSSRFMLKKIFDDRQQPLYMLCQTLLLPRISHIDFKGHLQTAAKKRWKALMTDAVTNTVLSLTACHSYYVNLLCDQLWEEDKLPTIEKVKVAWQNCLTSQINKCVADLEPLNSNRLKVLTILALLDGVEEPNGRFFLDKVSLSLGSIQKAVKFLLDHDYIYWTEHKKLMLVDPMLQTFIRANTLVGQG